MNLELANRKVVESLKGVYARLESGAMLQEGDVYFSHVDRVLKPCLKMHIGVTLNQPAMLWFRLLPEQKKASNVSTPHVPRTTSATSASV